MATEYRRMQQRRGTTAQWTSADPVLMNGEIAVDTSLKTFKVGDGVTIWSLLPSSLSNSALVQMNDYVTKAEEWAQNPEDDPVETVPADQFSALHWAAKAEFANSNAEAEATLAEGYKNDALGALNAINARITVSEDTPTGGANGDIWFVVAP